MDAIKKEIASQLEKNSKMSAETARVEFLKILVRQETFGSAFIECTQKADKGFPERIIVAVNKRGVSVVHPETKEV